MLLANVYVRIFARLLDAPPLRANDAVDGGGGDDEDATAETAVAVALPALAEAKAWRVARDGTSTHARRRWWRGACRNRRSARAEEYRSGGGVRSFRQPSLALPVPLALCACALLVLPVLQCGRHGRVHVDDEQLRALRNRLSGRKEVAAARMGCCAVASESMSWRKMR